jgi:hypothetical protein
MTLVIARRSPAAGTPGVRMSDLLPMLPTLLQRDATTTVLNISLPLLNPSASMRARQDEDDDETPARPSIDT